MPATTPSPTSRCRNGMISNDWCGSRAGGFTARWRQRWRRSSPAAAWAGWRMAHRLRPSTFQSFTVDALDAHRLYVVEVRHPVEVPGSERAHLQQWLTKRCGWDVRAPELDATGLKLVGGRLLPGPTGPASFLMYESASGERFTIYTARASTETTQMRYAKQDQDGALFWADRGVGYVVSGGSDRERLSRWRGWFMSRPRRAAAEFGRSQRRCPNSDIENLELEHRRVSKSHRVITRNCIAFDPPIDASGLDGVWYRAGPPSRPPLFDVKVSLVWNHQVRSLRGL